MAEQHGRALTSVAFATQRPNAGIDPERVQIGSRPGLDEDSPVEDQWFDPVALPDALGELTRRRDEERVVLPRLVILDQLVRLAVSSGREQLLRDDVTAALEPLLRSLALEREGDEDAGTSAALSALQTLALGETDEDPWEFFADAVETSFALTDVEVNKPRCRDKELPGGGPPEITVEFWTDRDVPSLAPYANPTHWPACSTYFAGMVPQGPPAQIVSPAGSTYYGWEAVLVERLGLFPPYDFVTPLRFTSYWAPGWTYVRTAYHLENKTPDITVDAGFIEVAKDPRAPDPTRPTRVTATKVIKFTSPDLDRWPTLACDTFWIEMAIQMAHDCACTGAGVPAPPF
jgi:hypothetical protein